MFQHCGGGGGAILLSAIFASKEGEGEETNSKTFEEMLFFALHMNNLPYCVQKGEGGGGVETIFGQDP